MNIVVTRQRIPQALSHLFLEKSQNPPDLLQRETLAPQLRDNGNLHHFLRQVDPPMAFLTWRNNVALIPPLQLPKADAGDACYIAAGVAILSLRGDGLFLFCFEHFSMPLCCSFDHSGFYQIPGSAKKP